MLKGGSQNVNFGVRPLLSIAQTENFIEKWSVFLLFK